MILVLMYPSSAEFWLRYSISNFESYHIDNRPLCDLPEEFYLDFSTSSRAAIKVARELNLSLPLTICGPTNNFNRRDNSLICEERRSPFPTDSFYRLDVGEDDVYIASPELTFLEAARKLNRAQLVCLGNSLCRLVEKKMGYPKYSYITSREIIKNYLSKADNAKGVKLAKSAVIYVMENSNSPMESKLATLMRLPQSLGGYGLPKFEMNKELLLSTDAKRFYGYYKLRGDFRWERVKYILEYNSDEFHSGQMEQDQDSDRQHAFGRSGYRAYAIRAKNVKDFISTEKFFRTQQKALCCTVREEYFNKKKPLREKNYLSLFRSSAVIA